jgi:hypothetical protein
VSATVRRGWRTRSRSNSARTSPLQAHRPVGLPSRPGPAHCSGAIESAQRTLVQVRLKRPGAWRREDLVPATLNLAVMRHNQWWEACGEKRRAQPPRMAARTPNGPGLVRRPDDRRQVGERRFVSRWATVRVSAAPPRERLPRPICCRGARLLRRLLREYWSRNSWRLSRGDRDGSDGIEELGALRPRVQRG